MKKVELAVVVVVLTILSLAVCGCEEKQPDNSVNELQSSFDNLVTAIRQGEEEHQNQVAELKAENEQLQSQIAEQQQPKVWGEGDLPDDWQGFFGNDNISRITFAQTQAINALSQALPGIIMRISKLEEKFDFDVIDINIEAIDPNE